MWDLLKPVEDQIATGKIDEFCGAMHLPLHWVSVVLNFQQLKILYGDSLGGQLPASEHQALERWMKLLARHSRRFSTGSKITHGPLPTGHQPDFYFCGLFALNSISHYHLNTPLLTPDPIVLVCRRMQITMDIISTMTVCILY